METTVTQVVDSALERKQRNYTLVWAASIFLFALTLCPYFIIVLWIGWDTIIILNMLTFMFFLVYSYYIQFRGLVDKEAENVVLGLTCLGTGFVLLFLTMLVLNWLQ